MKYVFAEFKFDPVSGELLRNGARVPLLGTASELLRVLIEDRHRVVSKEELLRRLWRGAPVEEGNLTTYVTKLRSSLYDDAQTPRFIRTHHGVGYRFIGELKGDTERRPGSRRVSGFALEWEGRELPLRNGENIVGREATLASVVINDPHVSSTHARIVVQGDTATIEDLGSKNQTFVRNERVTGPHPLQPGDGIRLGGPTVIFRRGTPKTITVTSTQTIKKR